jgi:hypothetical protein
VQRTASLLVVAVAFSFAAPAFAAVASGKRIPALYRSCKALNTRYPHGVGKTNAHDRTTSGSEPVRTFRRSTKLYRLAISYNRGLDRDKDGIACEKA